MPKGKRMILGAMAVTMTLGFCAVTEASEGFATPKDAMYFFISAINELDYDKALEAFPIDLAAENYDFESCIDRLGGWTQTYNMLISSSSNENVLFNKRHFRNGLEKKLDYFIFSFMVDPKYTEGLSIAQRPEEGDDIIAELGNVNIEDIQELKLFSLDYASPSSQNKDYFQNMYAARAAVYGGDTMEEYQVVYLVGSKFYWGGAQFIKYGDDYYLWELESELLNTNSYWMVEPVN